MSPMHSTSLIRSGQVSSVEPQVATGLPPRVDGVICEVRQQEQRKQEQRKQEHHQHHQ